MNARKRTNAATRIIYAATEQKTNNAAQYFRSRRALRDRAKVLAAARAEGGIK